jgi:hypothetical protein
MNIFYLDKDPRLAAQYHTDKHVVKMILESAQLLCTAVNVLAGEQVAPYKTTHVNHPCSVWVRESFDNFCYVYRLMKELDIERFHRWDSDKIHLSISKLELGSFNIYKTALRVYANKGLVNKGFTPLALAMPDYCKISSDPVECYREYYRKDKAALHKWTGRDVPYWIYSCKPKHKDIVEVVATRYTVLDRFGNDVYTAMVWDITEKGCNLIPESHGYSMDKNYVPDAEDLVYCEITDWCYLLPK